MIISIKSSSGGSSRGLVHYLAHSKLAPGKEGAEKREFFNESADDLDVSRANRHLSLTDAKPKPEELMHIVVAPSKEEIERIGDDLKTRKNALKKIARACVEQLEKEVNAKKLKWVAVAHFNTDNPHAHLAIQKEFLSENGNSAKLRIERQMLYYNERGSNGEKTTHKGALIIAAEEKIEEIARTRQNGRENHKISQTEKTSGKTKSLTEKAGKVQPTEIAELLNWSERRILAEEMLGAAEITRRERNIENLIAHGDKKRLKIKDEETGIVRRVSLFDIERKIENVSRRKAWAEYPKNVEKRKQFTVSVKEQELEKHEPLIRQIETIRRHILGFENRHLFKVQEKHTRLNNHKLLIEKKYERLQIAVPLPLFEPDEIEQLQSEAIKEQNLEKVLRLEEIRQNNASELNCSSRRDEDIRAVKAAKIIVELKSQAAEKRLLEFPQNKDFIKVKIGDAFWSRSELRQHENQAAQEIGFWKQIKSKTSAMLFPSDKKAESAEKSDYPSLHKAVEDELKNIENARRDEFSRLKNLSQTLNKIFDESDNPNKMKLAPAFSALELSELEDLALDAGRENFYENSLALQETYLLEKFAGKGKSANASNTLSPEDKIIGNFVLGRAEARIILAQIKITQAAKNLADYNRKRLFIKHRIANPKTGEIKELSLRETEPKNHYYLLDRFLDRMLESKEQKQERNVMRKAAKEKEFELKQSLTDSQNRLSRLESQKTETLEKYAGGGDVQPIFTPKEIAALDAWKDRTADKSEAESLEKIITQAERNNRVGKLQDYLENAARDLEISRPSLAENLEAKISRAMRSTERGQIIKNSQEITNRDSGIQRTDDPNLRENKLERIEPEKTIVKEKGRTR